MNTEKAIINFSGTKVALGPLMSELNSIYNKWNNDFSVNSTTATARPTTLEEQIQAYDQYTKDRSFAFFTIYDRETLNPIGMSYLSDIHNGNAEFGIVIGETDFHGKGYGTEATQLTLDYGFTVLGLNNIMLTVYEYNLAGIKAYEKAGFIEFGRRHEARWMSGRRWDVIYMECLSTNFKSKVLSETFTPILKRK